jgi:hypothetical protein
MKSFRRSAAIVGSILVAAFNAQSAMAISFKDDGASVWVARTQKFIEATTGEGLSNEGLFDRQKAACQGISGELFKIGGVVPIWAAESHRSFCRGVDGFYSKRNLRKACGDFKSAIGYLENAKPEKAPQDVVATAEKFRKTLEFVLSEVKKEDLC